MANIPLCAGYSNKISRRDLARPLDYYDTIKRLKTSVRKEDFTAHE